MVSIQLPDYQPGAAVFGDISAGMKGGRRRERFYEVKVNPAVGGGAAPSLSPAQNTVCARCRVSNLGLRCYDSIHFPKIEVILMHFLHQRQVKTSKDYPKVNEPMLANSGCPLLYWWDWTGLD